MRDEDRKEKVVGSPKLLIYVSVQFTLNLVKVKILVEKKDVEEGVSLSERN